MGGLSLANAPRRRRRATSAIRTFARAAPRLGRAFYGWRAGGVARALAACRARRARRARGSNDAHRRLGALRMARAVGSATGTLSPSLAWTRRRLARALRPLRLPVDDRLRGPRAFRRRRPLPRSRLPRRSQHFLRRRRRHAVRGVGPERRTRQRRRPLQSMGRPLPPDERAWQHRCLGAIRAGARRRRALSVRDSQPR